MGAGRGMILHNMQTPAQMLPRDMRRRIFRNNRYSIINLTVNKTVSLKPSRNSRHQEEIPGALRKLKLADGFNQPIINLPLNLLELEVGSDFRYALDLPPNLKQLVFARNSHFNSELILPPRLKRLILGDKYNKPTILPAGIQELRVGRASLMIYRSPTACER